MTKGQAKANIFQPMENSTLPDHEKLFDEICGKLSELSHYSPDSSSQQRLETMHMQIKRSQEDLKAAQLEIEEKIRTLGNLNYQPSELTKDMKRVTEQLETERMNNSKLSTDLAKSLELNLKLQFEIEEIRSRTSASFSEERRLTALLTDKNKSLTHELDLSQALNSEMRLELEKAKDRYQQDSQTYLKEIEDLTGTLQEYENHTLGQHEMMKNLSNVAENKMIELKLALDKRTIESQDYYSHLQQAMTQINVLRQENAALKDYISKLTALHQHKAAPAAP